MSFSSAGSQPLAAGGKINIAMIYLLLYRHMHHIDSQD